MLPIGENKSVVIHQLSKVKSQVLHHQLFTKPFSENLLFSKLVNNLVFKPFAIFDDSLSQKKGDQLSNY